MIALNFLIGGVILYLVWAFIYHKRDKSLTLSIALEYLLMAALALSLVMAVFLS